MSNRIKYLNLHNEFENDTQLVHFKHPTLDYTLCGVTLANDVPLMDDPYVLDSGLHEDTTDPVNCEMCISLVEFCKNVKRKDYV